MKVTGVTRSVLVILSAIVVIGILSTAADAIVRRLAPQLFESNGFSQNAAVLWVAVGYTLVFSAFGGWMVGRLALQRDVVILAALQFTFTLVANILLWDRRLLWFYAVVTILTPLSILAGGRLARRIR